ncbi:hypothetical protein SAMN05421819_4198 [Bryocella elongata]|uniref:Uncharacterized protein n=1 Tax=Bryocella elongata TaxID=863522 RepID=A0A1H6C2I4_9BACT|nr:hypothetical protein SAMN05421819_4198 [Bryocella elongata]
MQDIGAGCRGALTDAGGVMESTLLDAKGAVCCVTFWGMQTAGHSMNCRLSDVKVLVCVRCTVR